MSIEDMDLAELTELFRELGAPEPESWAKSQIKEGFPQLASWLFMKGAWAYVVPDNGEWIQRQLDHYDPVSNGPYDGISHSVKEMVDAGVSKEAITELVRCFQAEMMGSMLYLLEDSGIVEGNKYVSWGLFTTDATTGEPIEPLSGLQDYVLSTDPAGREMMPRKKS